MRRLLEVHPARIDDTADASSREMGAPLPCAKSSRAQGSPRIYASTYEQQAIDHHAASAAALMKKGVEAWTIYDNTMHDAATENALQLLHKMVT